MMTTETVEAELEHDGPNGNGNDNTSPLSGLKGILEAILFVSGEPLSVDRMLGGSGAGPARSLGAPCQGLRPAMRVGGEGFHLAESAGDSRTPPRRAARPGSS